MARGGLSLNDALNDLYTPEKAKDRRGQIPTQEERIKAGKESIQAYLDSYRGNLNGDGSNQLLNDAIRQELVDQKAEKYLRISLAFYMDALGQSKWSFVVALFASAFAVVLFTVFILMLVKAIPSSATDKTIAAYGTIILGIGGTISGLVSGVCFYVYGVAASQFSAFHARLDRLQRYFIAESLCSSISSDNKDDPACQARTKLVKTIAKAPLADAQMFVQPLQVGAGAGSGGGSGNGAGSGSSNGTGVSSSNSASSSSGNNAGSAGGSSGNANQTPAQVLALAKISIPVLTQIPQATLAQMLAQAPAPILAQALADVVPVDTLAQVISQVSANDLPLSQVPKDVLTKLPAFALAQSLVQISSSQSLSKALETLSPECLAETLAQIKLLSS